MVNRKKKNNQSRNPRRTGGGANAAKRRRNKPRARKMIAAPMTSNLLYLKSLHNPFEYRQVRVPGRFPTATQCTTAHGNITFTTNAAGFARICGRVGVGDILLYADVNHTENVVGGPATLLSTIYPISDVLRRPVAFAMKLRSTAAFSSEAGLVQAYQSPLGHDFIYDVYRDSPHQHIYSKGEVAKVSYMPFDFACLELQVAASQTVLSKTVVGFMITGASNQSYSLQYAITFESVGTANTDIVPVRSVEYGDPHAAISAISHNNPAKPDLWSVIKHRLGDAASAGVENLFATGNPVGALASAVRAGFSGGGYYQNQSSVRPGNQQLMLAY